LVNGEKHIDQCNNFGGRASQKVYHSVASFVVWITVFKQGLANLKCYVDDHFGVADKADVRWYVPYKKLMPSTLLELFDELGVLHTEHKQLSGSPLCVIGFDVDPNSLRVSMSLDKCAKLILACTPFMKLGACIPLCNFWAIQGHVNWSLNVYPPLCPALSALYNKTAGKDKPRALLHVNTDIMQEISWFIRHMEQSSGVHFLEVSEWTIHDQVDTLEAFTDASSLGIAVWFLGEHTGYQWALPQDKVTDGIFFYEALMVCCTAHLSHHHGLPKCLCTQRTQTPLTSSTPFMLNPPTITSSFQQSMST
jgi:hypothetical protein